MNMGRPIVVRKKFYVGKGYGYFSSSSIGMFLSKLRVV